MKAALSRGLIFVAVSSADRASKCWSGADDARVRAALTHVVSKIPGSEKLPVFAFGASSGGSFVGRLPTALKGTNLSVSCLLPQISALDRGSVKSFVSAATEGEKFPPTVFAHMSKDSHTASAVKQQMVTDLRFQMP